jgi:extracellular factor (EF) 3-hydroxypalmitic acid methyl ester biosynthesis protein
MVQSGNVGDKVGGPFGMVHLREHVGSPNVWLRAETATRRSACNLLKASSKQASMPRMQYSEVTDSLVVFQNAQGLEIRASVVRLARFQVVFEVYNTQEVFRNSEVLQAFTILVKDRPIYTGTAIVTGVVNTGLILVCDARLGDSWRDLDTLSCANGNLAVHFREFLQQWQQVYRISPDFKIIIADIHSFLNELHAWLQQLELGVRSHPSVDRLKDEERLVRSLEAPVVDYLTPLFRRFEEAVDPLSSQMRSVHQAFARQHLQQFVLTAPFGFRTYHKPLGYAGDYEMVNMMTRPPYEGGSLFAKLFNCWLLRQAPAEAHRNRIAFLVQKVKEETARVRVANRRARILSLGCGPAIEIQRLLSEWPASSQCELELVDFNQETLAHTREVLTDLARKHLRTTSLSFVKRSVQQILKEAHKGSVRPAEQSYDLIYCAGLLDYLSDNICARLISVMFEWLRPGGVLICTNVAPQNPFRHCMETFLDWHLNYRTASEMARLRPDGIQSDAFHVKSDLTGVNILVEVRKPENARA